MAEQYPSLPIDVYEVSELPKLKMNQLEAVTYDADTNSMRFTNQDLLVTPRSANYFSAKHDFKELARRHFLHGHFEYNHYDYILNDVESSAAKLDIPEEGLIALEVLKSTFATGILAAFRREAQAFNEHVAQQPRPFWLGLGWGRRGPQFAIPLLGLATPTSVEDKQLYPVSVSKGGKLGIVPYKEHYMDNDGPLYFRQTAKKA